MGVTKLKSNSKNYKTDDRELVRLSQQGDQRAMDTLIIKYQDRVYSTILKICTNSDDAAELTQDTFVKVIEKIGDFRGQSSFYTWLFRIAVNKAINFVKRKFKVGFKSLDETVKDCGNESRVTLKNYLNDGRESDPAVVIENSEAIQIVQAAISSLDEEHRSVILLRDYEGMSYSQISEVLELELGTVKSRLFRARDNLREILKEAIR